MVDSAALIRKKSSSVAALRCWFRTLYLGQLQSVLRPKCGKTKITTQQYSSQGATNSYIWSTRLLRVRDTAAVAPYVVAKGVIARVTDPPQGRHFSGFALQVNAVSYQQSRNTRCKLPALICCLYVAKATVRYCCVDCLYGTDCRADILPHDI